MTLSDDIKQEWTWTGIKRLLKENWPALLATFIAGCLTMPLLERMGQADSILMFFLFWTVLFLLASAAIGIARGIYRKIKV